MSSEPTPERPFYAKVQQEQPSATKLYMITVDEGWRSSIVCTDMYGQAVRAPGAAVTTQHPSPQETNMNTEPKPGDWHPGDPIYTDERQMNVCTKCSTMWPYGSGIPTACPECGSEATLMGAPVAEDDLTSPQYVRRDIIMAMIEHGWSGRGEHVITRVDDIVQAADKLTTFILEGRTRQIYRD